MLDGVDGCGKTTQIEGLMAYLKSKGHRVMAVREPGGPPIAEALRAILLDPANSAMDATAELLLYEAARAQLVAEHIRPALERGETVLSDRFYDSTTAYQGAGRNLLPEKVEPLHQLATGGLTPDLALLIDLPVGEGLKRARRAGALDRIEAESMAFHQRVRQGFLALAKREPGRVKVVNGSVTAEEVREAILLHVDTLLDAKEYT